MSLRGKTTRVGLWLIALALVVLFALANVRARRAVSSSETRPAKTVNFVTAPSTQRRIADFESELITITPHGFEPQEITRPQGRVLLMVDNQTDLAVSFDYGCTEPPGHLHLRKLRQHFLRSDQLQGFRRPESDTAGELHASPVFTAYHQSAQ